MKATPKQSAILKMAREKGGEFTKSDAVDLIGHNYFCNEDKHVGDVLGRMVKSDFIVRIKSGHFKLSESRMIALKKVGDDPNQKSLF